MFWLSGSGLWVSGSGLRVPGLMRVSAWFGSVGFSPVRFVLV